MWNSPSRRVFPLASAALHVPASAYIATAYTFTLMIAIFFSRTPAPRHFISFVLQCVSYVSGKETFVAGSTTAANTARGATMARRDARTGERRIELARRRGAVAGRNAARRADDVAVCIVRMMTRGERTGPRERGGVRGPM